MAPPPQPSPASTPPNPPPRRRLGLVALGGVAALAAGLAVAWLLVSGDRGGAPPPAATGGLVIDTADAQPGKIDTGRPLRCFVQGQFVGELSLVDCARRNGVATDALDVGLDETGALAAADQAGQTLTPLPPEAGEPATVEPVDHPDAVEAGQGAAITVPAAGACLRHGGGRWRRVGDMDLNGCVQALFAGRCEKPGAASYGRYGQQTLRLVTGKVEVSDDNKSFHTLVNQGPDCAIPPVG